MKIDKYIGKRYRGLGRNLKMSDIEIEKIEMQYRDFGPDEIVHQVLNKWREMNGSKAKKSVLATALCRADLASVAQKL